MSFIVPIYWLTRNQVSRDLRLIRLYFRASSFVAFYRSSIISIATSRLLVVSLLGLFKYVTWYLWIVSILFFLIEVVVVSRIVGVASFYHQHDLLTSINCRCNPLPSLFVFCIQYVQVFVPYHPSNWFVVSLIIFYVRLVFTTHYFCPFCLLFFLYVLAYSIDEEYTIARDICCL